MVVDDDDVRLECLAPHRRDVALLPIRAGLAETDFAARVELVPQRGGLRQRVHFRAVAGDRAAFPLQDGIELRDVVESGKNGVVAQGIELLLAQVVGAALHVAHPQRPQQRFEERDVLEVELFLQVLRAGGDDDALLLVAGAAQCGQQVGKRLARAGSSFDDQVALVRERLLNGLGHGVLAGAVLEGKRRLREDALRDEEVEARRQALGLTRFAERGFAVDFDLGEGRHRLLYDIRLLFASGVQRVTVATMTNVRA